MDKSPGNVINVPPPPILPGHQSYYMVYGEWTEIREQSAISTIENPNPKPGRVQMRIGINEVIAMTPLLYFVAVQGARPGYVVHWAMPISKEMYHWYKQVEKLVNEAMTSGQNGGAKQP